MNMLKKVIAVFSLAAAIFVSCSEKAQETLKTGDLVFVGIPMDYSLDSGSMDEAISSSTGKADSLNIIHVAIAEVDDEGSWIIDATIKHGVDRHPLDTFLTDFTLKDGSLPVLIVKRLKDPSSAEEFVANTRKFLGQPYDLHFLPDNDSLYCSELVRDSYINADGSYVFEANPMNFKDSEGNFPLYWEQLFARLGSPIPQGIPGTNPQSMSESPALVTVPVELSF